MLFHLKDAEGALVEMGLGGIARPVERVIALAAVVVVLERDGEADALGDGILIFGKTNTVM